MADLQLLDCFQPELVRLERVRYFPGQLLTADDMTADQDHFRQKLRRHNRFLHGWGVVCGLEVKADPTPDTPWRVQIGPGFALCPYGNDIDVAEHSHLDLAQCGHGAATSPCDPDVLLAPVAAEGETLYVAIKYAECVSRPVRAMPAGCACEEVACEYSRIRDSFEIACLSEAPADPELPLLCDLIHERRVIPCLPCPTEPWVVLAKVSLPASATTDVRPQNIDNLVRRQLFMTALLQEQLIDCCCPKEEPQPTLEADLDVKKKELFTSTKDMTIGYEITVTNLESATAAAEDVVLQDKVTPSVAAVIKGIMFSPQWASAAGAVPPFEAKLGTLEPGESVKLEVTISVSAYGDYQNTATVTTTTKEGMKGKNSATITSSLQALA